MSRLDIERVDVVFGNALCGILPGEWYLVLHVGVSYCTLVGDDESARVLQSVGSGL